MQRGIEIAEIVVGNDYEFGMIEKKTGLTVDAIADRAPVTVVTLGGQGSEIRADGQRFEIPIAVAEPMVGPTGGGDAYRAGLLAGLLLDKEYEVAGRMAALAARRRRARRAARRRDRRGGGDDPPAPDPRFARRACRRAARAADARSTATCPRRARRRRRSRCHGARRGRRAAGRGSSGRVPAARLAAGVKALGSSCRVRHERRV